MTSIVYTNFELIIIRPFSSLSAPLLNLRVLFIIYSNDLFTQHLVPGLLIIHLTTYYLMKCFITVIILASVFNRLKIFFSYIYVKTWMTELYLS